MLPAINHPLRRQMMELLHQNKRITVSALYHTLNIEQSVASQHLAILRRAGLLSATREARYTFYSVNYERLEQVHSLATRLNFGGY